MFSVIVVVNWLATFCFLLLAIVPIMQSKRNVPQMIPMLATTAVPAVIINSSPLLKNEKSPPFWGSTFYVMLSENNILLQY